MAPTNLSNIAVITANPDSSDSILTFFASEEVAHDHAQRISRDLHRDAWVVEVKHRHLADRNAWNQAQIKRSIEENYPKLPF